MPRKPKPERIECGHTECERDAVAWRYVPWTHVQGGLVSAYCADHLPVADRAGAKPVTCDHLPRLDRPA